MGDAEIEGVSVAGVAAVILIFILAVIVRRYRTKLQAHYHLSVGG
jgi:hypothetical protein